MNSAMPPNRLLLTSLCFHQEPGSTSRSAMLSETGARSSEVLCAVLGAPEQLWAEKASVREAFLDLAMKGLGRCSNVVRLFWQLFQVYCCTV